MTKKTTLKYSLTLFALFLTINTLVQQVNFRLDFTKDQRYTLSEPTKKLIDQLDNDLFINIYLSGNLPPEFDKLSKETKYLLEDLKAYNPNIKYNFINPSGKEEALVAKGLTPTQLTYQEEEQVLESVIFPWAVLRRGNKTVNINLLKSKYFENQQTQIQNSIQNLEFAFANSIKKIIRKKQKKVAVLKGNQEIEDIFQYDFLSTVGEDYRLAPFTLDSVQNQPQQTLAHLKNFDLLIITKPNEPFTESEKFTLDQYNISGGKIIWMVDVVDVSKDSIMQNGQTLAYQKDLNLTDYFFNYGVRINTPLVKDLYASPITLAVGNIGNNTQFQNFTWHYSPLVKTKNNHLITKNIGDIKLEYVTALDTLQPKLKKTVLLESSNNTKLQQVPDIITLASITEPSTPENYHAGKKIFGVLVEGNFTSAYANRVKPYNTNFSTKGINNKMIVFSDGDISTNQIHQGQPLELGLDKWTNQFYANKEILLNSVHYLLDEGGLILLKGKQVTIDTIDKPKALEEKGFWQLTNLILPLILLAIFGFTNYIYKKQQYTK